MSFITREDLSLSWEAAVESAGHANMDRGMQGDLFLGHTVEFHWGEA